jgi:DNA-binding response OmpR family regulator
LKFLIIEDNHKIAQSLKQGLTQENHIVDLAFDGLEGYDFASEEEYDIIILDLMLPKMDGITLCKKLRDENNHTPILMLTAKDQVDDKVNGLNSGADDYLAKPFAFSELLARLNALARRPKKTRDQILIYKNLSLNTTNYEVKRNNKSLKLSKKEYTLVEYFLRHPKTILSKTQIINHAWDFEADILENTVEVYIGYLRKKLGRPNLIQTVRGFGYKLE